MLNLHLLAWRTFLNTLATLSSVQSNTLPLNKNFRVILMYLSLSQSQSSLSDPIGRLESIVISQLEGIYSQIEDVFQCVKSDSNDSQVHQATDYVTSRLNLEIRKFKFSNSSKSILESSMIQFIRRVSAALKVHLTCSKTLTRKFRAPFRLRYKR